MDFTPIELTDEVTTALMHFGSAAASLIALVFIRVSFCPHLFPFALNDESRKSSQRFLSAAC